MTPDGIASDDWDLVHDLALEVVSLSSEEDPACDDAAHRLLDLLDDLQQKYGPLPSLLATRADYVASQADREYWLLAAHAEAVQRNDVKNQKLIAHSLACHYVEEVPNDVEGAKWLSSLEQCLQVLPHDSEARDVMRLRDVLARLQK